VVLINVRCIRYGFRMRLIIAHIHATLAHHDFISTKNVTALLATCTLCVFVCVSLCVSLIHHELTRVQHCYCYLYSFR